MQHNKRYMVVFDIWSERKFHEDKTEYDTIDEVNDEIKLIEEVYADTPRPKSSYFGHYKWQPEYMGEALWGYAVIDFEKEEVIKWGHDSLKYADKNTDIRHVKDIFFRGEDEIPKGYKWDVGEYEGWLQYRWGNGRNAVALGENAVVECKGEKCQCVRHCKINKKKKFRNFAYDESEELALDELNEKILAESKSS